MAAEEILAFLGAIDTELAQHAGEGETLDLYLIGRSALILGYGVRLMTKDVDVVEVEPSRLLTVAIEMFKKGGLGHTGHGLYLEAVSSGLPPIPIGSQERCVEVAGPWRVIRPKRPEPHDLVVTKLKRSTWETARTSRSYVIAGRSRSTPCGSGLTWRTR
jgi:hypothetical protein